MKICPPYKFLLQQNWLTLYSIVLKLLSAKSKERPVMSSIWQDALSRLISVWLQFNYFLLLLRYTYNTNYKIIKNISNINILNLKSWPLKKLEINIIYSSYFTYYYLYCHSVTVAKWGSDNTKNETTRTRLTYGVDGFWME